MNMQKFLTLACLAGIVALLAIGSPLDAQPKIPPEMSDDPDVQKQLTQLADGFELQLVASEPTIVNPLQINFDTQGRLWVLCAPGYPQVLPGQKPKDYVVVLDDIGPDGKARKSQVFADGLMVPTGMMPGDGGVYVGQGETLLHLRDTKGAGKADEKRVVLTGFGTNDTHHTLNTFRWGPDGALHFNQGVYIRSTVETPYGPRKHFGGGIWKLRTDRLRLDVYDRSVLPNNTWGHAFDAWGQPLIASAWPGALNQILPDSPLQTSTQNDAVPDLKMTQIGGERHCGLEVVGGRHLPDDWQGNLLTGDFLAHRIYRYALKEEDGRFTTKQLPPLAVSKHRKFRPIDIRMGPDGAIYIADLYQQIIQHNQVDFRDPRRDHTRGRIWRIVRKDRPLVAIPKLVGVPADEVASRLKDAEPWTRLHARRALAERDAKESAAALDAFVAKLDANDPELQRHLLEALWTYQAIGRPDPILLARLLRSPNHRVRGEATKAIGAWHDRLPSAARLLAAQAVDSHPRVRLEAALAASHIPSAEALQSALLALDHPTDKLTEFALKKAAIVLQPYWQPEFQAGKLTFGGRTKHLAFALQAIRAPDAVPALLKLVRDDKVSPESVGGVLQIIAALGDDSAKNFVFRESVSQKRKLPADALIRVLETLETMPVKSNHDWYAGPLSGLFRYDSVEVAAAAMRLAGIWKLERLRGELMEPIVSPKPDPARRAAAIDALARLGGAESTKLLVSVAAAKEADPAYRVQALVGLLEIDPGVATQWTKEFLLSPHGAEAEPLFTAFVQRRDGAKSLAEALKKSPPHADSARVGLRTLVNLGVSPPELLAELQRAAGEENRQRKLDAAEAKRLIALVKDADPARGEAVFRRSSLGCINCHAIGGAGGIVGPDLSAIGASAQLDYLLESIVLPSKVIREGYNTAHVVTTSGKILHGIVLRESPKELVLRDPLRDEIVLKTSEIDEKSGGGSLMPDGLDRALTDGELVDLVRFLSELGKPGAFGVSHVPTARRWQALASPAPSLLLLEPAALGQALQQDGSLPWTTAYSKVSGELPLAELVGKAKSPLLLRCQIDVVAAGRIGLSLGSVDGVQLWIDGVPTPLQARTTLDLPRGPHTLTLRVAPNRAALRCELFDVPGSTGQARFPAGR